MKINKNERKREYDGMLLSLLLYILFSLILCVLYCVVIGRINLNSIVRNRAAIFWIGEIIIFSAFALSVIFTVSNNQLVLKILTVCYAVAAFFLAIAAVLVNTEFFSVVTSVESLREYVSKAGSWTWLLFILLQFLQVVILPIPGMISTGVGVALFGPFKATLYSLIGIVSGSLLAFIIGRKLGIKAVNWIVGEDDLNKWLKKLKGKDSLFLTVAFVFPLFPDDILCFVAGLSTMSFSYFFIMNLFSRMLAIVCTCFSVNFIPFNTWWGIIIWIALAVTVAAAFVFVYKNLDLIQLKIRECRKKFKRSKGRS